MVDAQLLPKALVGSVHTRSPSLDTSYTPDCQSTKSTKRS